MATKICMPKVAMQRNGIVHVSALGVATVLGCKSMAMLGPTRNE